MIFKFKSRKQIKFIVLLEFILLLSMVPLWFLLGKYLTSLDSQVLDLFYTQAIQHGSGPERSPRIVYVTITDDSYTYFGKNILDREVIAPVNEALAQFGVAAVAYDIIFARPSTSQADQRFADSLGLLPAVYLPLGLEPLSSAQQPFQWQGDAAYERLRTQLCQPHEQGRGRPFYAAHALMQLDDFAEVTSHTGHISASPDPDGVYRHLPLLFKVDTGYLPALALTLFLDAVRVPCEALTVEWGRTLTVPALPGSTLSRDVVIPIDAHGRVFVPYPQVWGSDFKNVPIYILLQYLDDIDLRGNLREFFENKFVFIADTSTGIADAGQTPFESNVPLVAMHTALMNALLTDSFYRQWSFSEVVGLLGLLAILIGCAALLQASRGLYVTGGLSALGLIALTWVACLHFTLLPIVTVASGFAYLFFGLVLGLGVALNRERAFIRNAFAKYVPEPVVNELLRHPELLDQLGGEERVLSVMFTDIADFTTLSEQMAPRPQELVRLLNAFLQEMTPIVLEEGGLIDKFVGDAIMAQFGAPLPLPHHADVAVRTALRMQRRLEVLRPQWVSQGWPEVHCSVGINTGPMVVGNIGSDQRIDYTAIGDAVNLASRLQGANKHYKTMVMISEFTYQALSPGLFHTRLLDVIRVKGKSQAVKVYEVYGETSDPISPEDLQYYQAYTAAFEAYLARRFDLAHTQFTTALAVRPSDAAAHEMLERIASLDPEKLPDDWDGAMTFETK
jgi:adenylate cyclase